MIRPPVPTDPDGGVRRAITGFRRDEAGDWIALLDCGHGQHMRHRPPFADRAWVESAAGRAGMLGTMLDCPRCRRMEWPDGLVFQRRTKSFDESTLPAGLRRNHNTARGIWGRLHVCAGTLHYHVEAPISRSFRLEAGEEAVIVPGIPHRVAPEGKVRFFVAFWRAAPPPDPAGE